MKNQAAISIYQDTRRAKKDGTYPVKLRVFTSNPVKQKLFTTGHDLTEADFKKACGGKKPKKGFEELRTELDQLVNDARKTAKEIKPFSMAMFEKKLFRAPNSGALVSYHYNEKINQLEKRNQFGTADNYKNSRAALIKYLEEQKLGNGKGAFNELSLLNITPDWLEDFEQVSSRRLSSSSMGMYLRALRTIFNKAIREGEIDAEIYPFGEEPKFVIPSAQGVKKALSKEDLNSLFYAEPSTPQQQEARDFFFFSYACGGINMADIAGLRNKDIQSDRISFIRSKTKKTSKAKLKLVVTMLNDYSQEFIHKYRRDSNNPEDFVFNIIQPQQSGKAQRNRIKNFTRYINQHLKKLASPLGLPTEISTNWARHSVATQGVRRGYSIELMQELLGHNNIKTTQGYLASFEDKTKAEFAKNIMDF